MYTPRLSARALTYNLLALLLALREEVVPERCCRGRRDRRFRLRDWLQRCYKAAQWLCNATAGHDEEEEVEEEEDEEGGRRRRLRREPSNTPWWW
jgi:hypothetical protein